jgi:hypothetical protein
VIVEPKENVSQQEFRETLDRATAAGFVATGHEGAGCGLSAVLARSAGGRLSSAGRGPCAGSDGRLATSGMADVRLVLCMQ